MTPDQKIRYGMKYPHRIHADYDVLEDATWLHFTAADGSRISVLLSREQAQAMVGLGANDPHAQARELYVRGHIELDEFERRLGVAS